MNITIETEIIRQVSFNEVAEYAINFSGPDIEVMAKMLADVLDEAPHLIVTTPTVYALYTNKLSALMNNNFNCKTTICVVDVDENSKDMANTIQIAEACFKAELKRNSVIIAIGGGVVMDLACFVASLYRRGIEFMKVPTTLIGQIDAGIGVKGGVNFKGKKSLLGCFYLPKKVIINTLFLETLERDAILQGMAEIIKMAMVSSNSLFTLVEENVISLIESRFQVPEKIAKKIIEQSIHDMMDELEPNLKERKSLKRLVDFGHTISPLLEAKTSFQLGHGYAVSIDMALSAAISFEMGKMEKSDFIRFINLLIIIGLPVKHDLLTPEFIQSSFAETEKHRAGYLNIVLPISIGKCEIVGTREEIPFWCLNSAIELLEEISQPKVMR